MRISSARAAGLLLLLLTAVATAVSVMTRLSGSMEPLEGSPIQVPTILDAGQYIIAGAARTVSGLALVAAAVFLRLALRRDQPVAGRDRDDFAGAFGGGDRDFRGGDAGFGGRASPGGGRDRHPGSVGYAGLGWSG